MTNIHESIRTNNVSIKALKVAFLGQCLWSDNWHCVPSVNQTRMVNCSLFVPGTEWFGIEWVLQGSSGELR